MSGERPPPDFEHGCEYTERGWLPHEFCERAAIMQYEGGMSRRDAERAARKDYTAVVTRRQWTPGT